MVFARGIQEITSTGDTITVTDPSGPTTNIEETNAVTEIPVPVDEGGTGATTGPAALENLGAAPLALWEIITTGNITLPRLGATDSGSVGATPASETIHYTYFIAQQNETANNIRFQTGGTAQATNTYTNVGLYTVNPSTGALTLVAEGTEAALSGTYASQTFTLTAAYSLVAGTLYAVGLLQHAATVASVLGSWFNGAFLGAATGMAFTGGTGLTTLPTTAAAPTNANSCPFYYEIY